MLRMKFIFLFILITKAISEVGANYWNGQSDQPLLIDKILGYAGVMSRDQLALQLSASKEQQIDIDGQK